MAKTIHDFTKQTILVVCYTNHALDDILTSLLDIGIPQESMVRLGGKSTPRTEPLSIHKQYPVFRRDKASWVVIDTLKEKAEGYRKALESNFNAYLSSTLRLSDILEHLEFDDVEYYQAFWVPLSTDGSTRVGKKGQAVDKFYLIRQWTKGWDAGIYKNEAHIKEASRIWTMPIKTRVFHRTRWENAIFKERIDVIYAAADKYNHYQELLAQQWSEKDTDILTRKRIIGCTTTAAAKYSNSIQAASPDVVLVEEAGEILESHVLTALGPKTAQLIMIGDHK